MVFLSSFEACFYMLLDLTLNCPLSSADSTSSQAKLTGFLPPEALFSLLTLPFLGF